MPQDALYCDSCGARVADFTVAQSDFSPSHFNSGMTATSEPLTTLPVEGAGPPPSTPARRAGRRRGIVLVVIVALAVLLIGVTVETVFLGSATYALNSPSTPFSGKDLYSAYASNQTKAVAAYTNRTIYIQDTLDDGVNEDSAGQYFSSVSSGEVVLVWGASAQLNQLYAGTVVLAKCSVEGLQASNVTNPALYLKDCDLISAQSQTTTSSAPNAPVANL